MYVVSRRGHDLTVHPGLIEAVRAATQVSDLPCWIWRLEVSRLGTLKRIEVPREEIQSTGIEGIWCILNRFEKDTSDPVDGQLMPNERPRRENDHNEARRKQPLHGKLG